jgi:YbbR domain-containing protein
MFLIFLALSSLFWMLTKLSKEYTHIVLFNTNYTNLPNDKILQSKPKENLAITLKSYGFGIFNYTIKKKKITIDLQNLQKTKKDRFYYLTNKNVGDFQKQISSDATIINISPDTLFFDLGILNSKKVKINPNIKLQFKTGYNLAEKLQITPEFITVTGSEKQLDSITSITTEKLIFNNVSKDFEKTIAVILPKKSKGINFSHDKIEVIGKVDKFTEGTLSLPYQLINVPSESNISAFVDKVTITYRVSLANFDKVLPTDFNVVCDFFKTQQDSLNYLIPVFEKQSNLVLDAKITPQKIEFLIKK